MSCNETPRYLKPLILFFIFAASVALFVAAQLVEKHRDTSGHDLFATAQSVSQSINPALLDVAAGDGTDGSGGSLAFDAPNLESYIQASPEPLTPRNPAPGVIPGETLAGPTIDPSQPTRFQVNHTCPVAAAAYRRLTIYTDLPKPGAAVISTTPESVAVEGDAGSRPIIEHLWTGLGGHRSKIGPSFPVIVVLRGGGASFKGWFQVKERNVEWSAPVSLQPHSLQRIELDVSPAAGADVFIWRLKSAGPDDTVGQIIAERPFLMEGTGLGRFWITSGLTKGLDDSNRVNTIIPVQLMNVSAGGSFETLRLAFPLQTLMPEQAPESSAGWAAAQVIGVDPSAESKLSPAAVGALKQWVVEGGHLVVAPGSHFLRGVTQHRSTIVGGVWPAGASGSPNRFPLGFGEIISRGQSSGAAILPERVSPDALMTLTVDPNLTTVSNGAWALASFRLSLFQWARAAAPTLSTPRWPVIVVLGLLYAGLFGPFSLWLMRRVRRILHVWLVVPAIAAGGTVVILLAGGLLTRSMRMLNTSAVALVSSGCATGAEQVNQEFFTSDPCTYALPEGRLALQSFSGGQPDTKADDVSAADDHILMLRNLPSYTACTFTEGGVLRLPGTLSVDIRADGSGSVSNNLTQREPASVLRAGFYVRSVPALGEHQVYSFGRTGWQYNNVSSGVSSSIGPSLMQPIQQQLLSVGASAPRSTPAVWIIPDIPAAANRTAAPGADQTLAGHHQRILVVTGSAPEVLCQLPASEQRRLEEERAAQERTAAISNIGVLQAGLQVRQAEIKRIQQVLQARSDHTDAQLPNDRAINEAYRKRDAAWLQNETHNLQEQCRLDERLIQQQARRAGISPATMPVQGSSAAQAPGSPGGAG